MADRKNFAGHAVHVHKMHRKGSLQKFLFTKNFCFDIHIYLFVKIIVGFVSVCKNCCAMICTHPPEEGLGGRCRVCGIGK